MEEGREEETRKATIGVDILELSSEQAKASA